MNSFASPSIFAFSWPGSHGRPHPARPGKGEPEAPGKFSAVRTCGSCLSVSLRSCLVSPGSRIFFPAQMGLTQGQNTEMSQLHPSQTVQKQIPLQVLPQGECSLWTAILLWIMPVLPAILEPTGQSINIALKNKKK